MDSRILRPTCAFGLLSAGLLGASLLSGCAASPARWAPPEDLAADDAVVYVSSDCSAVLVGERSALTAAHCVEQPEALHVRVGRRRIPVEACAVHPRAYGEPRECGAGPGRTQLEHDLAVLTLAEPAGVAPVPVLLAEPERVSSRDAPWWRERVVRLIGWDRRPRIVGPLARRSGDNRIIAMRRGTFLTEPSGRTGFHTVIGDSGGPALVRVGGVEQVVGVLRGGPAPGSRASVYAATFDADNARWLVQVLPAGFGRDLALDEDLPFGEPHPLSVR